MWATCKKLKYSVSPNIKQLCKLNVIQRSTGTTSFVFGFIKFKLLVWSNPIPDINDFLYKKTDFSWEPGEELYSGGKKKQLIRL